MKKQDLRPVDSPQLFPQTWVLLRTRERKVEKSQGEANDLKFSKWNCSTRNSFIVRDGSDGADACDNDHHDPHRKRKLANAKRISRTALRMVCRVDS